MFIEFYLFIVKWLYMYVTSYTVLGREKHLNIISVFRCKKMNIAYMPNSKGILSASSPPRSNQDKGWENRFTTLAFSLVLYYFLRNNGEPLRVQGAQAAEELSFQHPPPRTVHCISSPGNPCSPSASPGHHLKSVRRVYKGTNRSTDPQMRADIWTLDWRTVQTVTTVWYASNVLAVCF